MKKLISIALMLSLVFSLSACAGGAKPGESKVPEKPEETLAPEKPEEAQTPENPEETQEPEETQAPEKPEDDAGAVSADDFDSEFLKYVLENGSAGENFMISALSFRAALCLVTEGAAGETQQELLSALGFRSVEEMENWYASVKERVDDFAALLQDEQESAKEYGFSDELPDRAFSLVNSVWNNLDTMGSFREDYKQLVEKIYGAAAYEKGRDEITEAVNSWCDENTNGMIPEISDDLSKAASVLVNALYVRSPWVNSFEEWLTHEDTFTDIDGKEQTKEFMEQTEDSLYYEDEKSKLVVIPMEGDLQFAAVLGDDADLQEMLRSASYEEVHIKIPKTEIESTFGGNIMTGFLKERGVDKAWDDRADFSAMSDFPWYVDDIIQKTKLKTDEEGLEAAAVTAIVMEAAGALMPEEREIKEFIADEPFRFYILSGLGEDTETLLFAGQYVK